MTFPRGFGKRRVYIDAGHGAEGNAGVASVRCEQEMDFTLRAAEELGARLEQTGRFRVRLSRRAGEAVSYPKRLEAAAAFGAEAIISLHADARGMAHAWEVAPGTLCWRNDDSPGFTVLYSDKGAASLNAARQRLARALARQMAASGLTAYDGRDYTGLYLGDPAQAGAFIDRRFLFVLRKPQVPSVIIETHHFLDLEETARWAEPRTLDAFASAVAAALADALGPKLDAPQLSPRNPGDADGRPTAGPIGLSPRTQGTLMSRPTAGPIGLSAPEMPAAARGTAPPQASPGTAGSGT